LIRSPALRESRSIHSISIDEIHRAGFFETSGNVEIIVKLGFFVRDDHRDDASSAGFSGSGVVETRVHGGESGAAEASRNENVGLNENLLVSYHHARIVQSKMTDVRFRRRVVLKRQTRVTDERHSG